MVQPGRVPRFTGEYRKYYRSNENEKLKNEWLSGNEINLFTFIL